MRGSDDVIFLHDLRVETVVGIWAWERKIRQTVSIDIEMGPTSAALRRRITSTRR